MYTLSGMVRQDGTMRIEYAEYVVLESGIFYFKDNKPAPFRYPFVKGINQMNQPNHLRFEKLCRALKLGEVMHAPEEVPGGLLHKMFAVETSKGKYAIKALNPKIMERPTALNNFIRSERIANIAAQRLPAQPAKTIDSHFIHHIDNQYYLVFDWIDGYSLRSHEINRVHCEKMGALLAEIHKTDFSQIEKNDHHVNRTVTDWNAYLNKGKEVHSVWVNSIHEHIEQLYIWSDKAKISSSMLTTEQVISHGDLEPKNVMWLHENPVIIDWESAGYTNPMHDLIETAIYWSLSDSGSMDKERFLGFISAYQERSGTVEADWGMVLDHGYLGKLDWLEYSLKRSLWIECLGRKRTTDGNP